MRRLGLDDKQLTPRIVLSRISWAKNHMLDSAGDLSSVARTRRRSESHISIEIYSKELERANALDFDDLLLEAVRLLRAVPEVRSYYNRRFRYMLIDEYQDTNRPQYELMKMLAGEEKNVCVVGDEDQSIYSWRGADIRNILEFEKDFPNAKIIRLEQNYRSTQVILEAAGAVVANNIQRKGKTLWTSRDGGAQIGYYEALDGENEALFIADHIQKYMRQTGNEAEPPRIAVLYRTNSQSRLVEEALRRYGISVHHGRRILVLRPRRDQGHAQLSEAGAESERLDCAATLHQHAAARHRQDDAGNDGAAGAGDRHEHLGCDPRGRQAAAGPDAGRNSLGNISAG